MMLIVDIDQARVLREVLESNLIQLRIESARADMGPFREQLQERERLLEHMLDQMPIRS